MTAKDWQQRQTALTKTVKRSHGIGPASQDLPDEQLEEAIAGALLLMRAAIEHRLPSLAWFWRQFQELLTTERGRRRAVAAGEAAGEVEELEKLFQR